MKAVIDTNVLLVANQMHQDASPDCVIACVNKLIDMQNKGITVIDDAFLILGEYQNKTNTKPAKRPGDVFLKWLLQNMASKHVEMVSVTQLANNTFAEFPDKNLEPHFDAPDRKFAAVANAHPDKPPILQSVDCKWLDWWPQLRAQGVEVDFICPNDVCKFYTKKFPNKPAPVFPN